MAEIIVLTGCVRKCLWLFVIMDSPICVCVHLQNNATPPAIAPPRRGGSGVGNTTPNGKFSKQIPRKFTANHKKNSVWVKSNEH